MCSSPETLNNGAGIEELTKLLAVTVIDELIIYEWFRDSCCFGLSGHWSDVMLGQ